MSVKITKILIFTFFVFFIFVSCSYLKGNEKKLLQEYDKFFSQITERQEYIKNISKVLALDPNILNIYKELRNKAESFERPDKNKELFYVYGHKLKDIFSETIIKYERDFGLPVSYNFYIPPSQIWLIPDKPYGEDIYIEDKSREKPNVVEAISKNRIISGIMTQNNTLIFSSVTPIQSETGVILGAVEVWTTFSSILDHYLMSNPLAKIIVILNKDQKNYFTTLPKELVYENGIVYYTNVEKADYKKTIDMAMNIKDKGYLDINNKKYIVRNLYNFANQEIGRILFSIF
jgi:hypothetical protein